MARVVSWLGLVLLISGCAGPLVLEKDGALAVIPRQGGDSGLILVDTLVNGEGPFRFALDTAATISVLLESTAEAANVVAHADKRIRIQGMTGSGTFPAAEAGRIDVGSLRWDSPLFVLLPDSSPVAGRADGILGIDFLSRYAVAYSADDRAIRFYPRELVQEQLGYRGWSTIPLDEIRVTGSDASILGFGIMISGRRVSAIFDLGSDTSLMNHRAARVIGVHTRKRRADGISGAFGSTIVATKLIFWEIWVGGQRWHSKDFLVADFPVFEALGLQRIPAAVAGTDLFGRRDFVIDFAGMRLLVRHQ